MSSQVKLNKNVTIGLIVAAVLVAILIAIISLSDNDKIREAYEDLDKDHVLVEVSYSEFQTLGNTESGKYLVVISRPTCPACQAQLPYIDRAVQSRYESGIIEMNVVYYLNTDEMTSDEISDLKSAYGVQGYTPDLLVMQNNSVFSSSLDWVDDGNYSGDTSDYATLYRRFLNAKAKP